MTSHERVLTALAHREPDRVPVTLAYGVPEKALAFYGRNLDVLPIRQDIYPVSHPLQAGHSEAPARQAQLAPGQSIDAWGVTESRSSTGSSYSMNHPLQAARTPEDIRRYPFPHAREDQETVGTIAAAVRRYHEDGRATQGSMSSTVFERSWYLMGMEETLTAMYTDPALVHTLFDQVTAISEIMARNFARAGVDVLRLGDDIGTQKGLMMSLDMWRTFLKPYLKRVIDAARSIRPDMPVLYHSDGDVQEAIKDLIEIGITILNPVQPECMAPFEIKRRYGSDLTLWGTVGTQTLMPFGTPQEVTETVRKYIETLGRDGGYVIGPTHSINTDVPWENIVAFYEAVDRYGTYANPRFHTFTGT